jgi:D-tyrosyl-tRNA(Tyr) deacylase
MIAVVQRVAWAEVVVDGTLVSRIENGLLVLLGVSVEDGTKESEWLAQKISQLRIFSDSDGKMNLSVSELQYEVLVVSQFTLLADASHGNRPSYINAARPEQAIPLYENFCQQMESRLTKGVKKGVFGADMKISLLNDGPVTIVLDTQVLMKKRT